jgi:hypothetical protein
VSRTAIEPWFAPGSGWYVPAACAPGSLKDIEDRNRAAFRCVVFLLRDHAGTPMEPDSIMAALRYDGALVCERSRTVDDGWDAGLFSPPAMSNVYLQLWNVRLVRLKGYIRQYQGVAWDRKRERQVRQTWLCVPDAETGLRVVNQMPRPSNRAAFASTFAPVLNPTAGRA